MIARRRAACACLFASLALLVSCKSEGPKEVLPPPPSLAVSSDEIVARVGDARISKETVLAIAKAQHITPREAADLAVRDALFAQEALARRLDVKHRQELDGVLTRALAAQILAQVKAQGPIRDEELGELVSKHYYYFVARPEAWATVHAVVKLAPDAGEEEVKKAKKVAEAIHDAEVPVAARAKATIPPAGPDKEAGQFLDVAKAVDPEGLDVVTEVLPPVAKDGATVMPNGRQPGFDPRFVAGATALQTRGDLSEPVRSSFGFHVIMLRDRIPGAELKVPELIDLIGDDVYDARARAVTEPLLAALRKATPTTIERNADALLSLLHIGDDAAPVGAPGDPSQPAQEPPLSEGPPKGSP